MIIGLISDTHGLLRNEVVDILKTCDLIIHAGDIGKIEIIEKLKDINEVKVIKGNCDKNIDMKFIPDQNIININDKNIFVIHNINDLNKNSLKDIDVVVYGHSHKKDIYKEDGIIYINPGSIGPKRFKLPITMAKIYIDEEIDINKLSKDIFKFDSYYIEFIEL